MKNILIYITGFILTLAVSCENVPGGKPLPKKEKSPEPEYEYEEIYLHDLGTEVKIPVEFNLMDTSEIRKMADSISLKYTENEIYVKQLREVYNNPKEKSIFVDRKLPINTIQFVGYRHEDINDDFLEKMVKILLYAPTKEDSLYLKNNLIRMEKGIVETDYIKYAKVSLKYKSDPIKWNLIYYYIEGENMLLGIKVRTLYSHGYEEMVKTLKLSL